MGEGCEAWMFRAFEPERTVRIGVCDVESAGTPRLFGLGTDGKGLLGAGRGNACRVPMASEDGRTLLFLGAGMDFDVFASELGSVKVPEVPKAPGQVGSFCFE